MLAGTPGGTPRHSRLAIGVFAALFVMLLGAGYLVYDHLVERSEQQSEATLNHIADIRTAGMSSWIQERTGDAKVFSSGKFLGETMQDWIRRGAPADTTRQQVFDQLRAIQRTYDYLEVAILGVDGTTLISTREEKGPLDPDAAELARQAAVTNRLRISRIYLPDDFPQSVRMVDIAIPLLDVQDRSDMAPSVLLLRADAGEHLSAFLKSMPLLSADTDILLAEPRGGRVVAMAVNENAPHFAVFDELPVSPDAFTPIASTANNRFVLKDKHGNFVIAVARKIPNVDWYLVTMLDRSAIRDQVTRLAWVVAGACASLLLLLGFAMLSWWKERKSQFRLQALQVRTEKELLQRQYDYLSRYANDMIVLADAQCRIININDKTTQLLGQQRAALLHAPVDTLFLPSCKPAVDDAMERLRRQGMALFEATLRDTPKPIHVEVSARYIDQDGSQFLQLICRDITERRQSEAALRESQQRLDGILGSIRDIVWSFSADMTRIHYINQSAEQIYGYPVSALLANPQLWFDIIHPEDRERVRQTLAALTPQHPMCDSEHRIVHGDNSIHWVHCRSQLVLDADGKPVRIDGVTTDITERKAAEQQVQTLAYYDNVTSLPNRTLMHDRLAQAIHMATRSGKKVALLFMDLDNFKHINDSLGHHVGDVLLRSIGERLGQCVREEDTVARIGGDEFIVVLPDIDKGADAVHVAEKILVATAAPFETQGHQIHTTISIGISIYPDDAEEPNELIRHADSALYQAKAQGRANYQFFTQELNAQITRSTTIERELRHAIETGELSLWYQPLIDTRTSRLVGAEALLRWHRDEDHFLSPVEFIPVAEERGLIARIGEWGIREACEQCRQWQRRGLHTVPVAVNVSPLQFQQKGFASLVTGILRETGLDPSCLDIEITESAIMRRASQVAELAQQLRAAGIGISIDDFGTGYSSLSYLKHIPIDKIKIDRSFIADMLTDDDDDAITFAIINLAHSLNLRVIAEGVETRGQIDRLRTFGCDEIQGNFYSAPVSAADFERFLASGTITPHGTEMRQ